MVTKIFISMMYFLLGGEPHPIMVVHRVSKCREGFVEASHSEQVSLSWANLAPVKSSQN